MKIRTIKKILHRKQYSDKQTEIIAMKMKYENSIFLNGGCVGTYLYDACKGEIIKQEATLKRKFGRQFKRFMQLRRKGMFSKIKGGA